MCAIICTAVHVVHNVTTPICCIIGIFFLTVTGACCYSFIYDRRCYTHFSLCLFSLWHLLVSIHASATLILFVLSFWLPQEYAAALFEREYFHVLLLDIYVDFSLTSIPAHVRVALNCFVLFCSPCVLLCFLFFQLLCTYAYVPVLVSTSARIFLFF